MGTIQDRAREAAASLRTHLAGWQDGLPVMRAELSMTAEKPRHERGPPAELPRLFLRHRALLL